MALELEMVRFMSVGRILETYVWMNIASMGAQTCTTVVHLVYIRLEGERVRQKQEISWYMNSPQI